MYDEKHVSNYKWYFFLYADMEDSMMVRREAEPTEEMNKGKIDSIFRQYSKKARDFQRPWTATMSGGTPIKRRWVAPPMR